MILIYDPDHFTDIERFAKEVGALENLRERLQYLGTYAQNGGEKITRCKLFKDWADLSFAFMIQILENGEWRDWFNGGLIYSGPGRPSNGSAPQMTVSLDPDAASGAKHMWSVHT